MQGIECYPTFSSDVYHTTPMLRRSDNLMASAMARRQRFPGQV